MARTRDDYRHASPRRINRRHALRRLSATLLAARTLPAWSAAPDTDEGRPFNPQWLREHAEALARHPYVAPTPPHPALLARIDYDTYQAIRFDSRHALWPNDPARLPVEPFHLGRYARLPVALYRVENGSTRRIEYRPDLFDYSASGLDGPLPDDLGFAGFRVMNTGGAGDWLAFMGASYFRSAGVLDQYGLSARGIAIDTAMPGGEEFPRFSAFWLEQPGRDGAALSVHALLEGPSLTGAYRIDCRRGDAVTTDVHATLFMRRAVARLGIAPLTSMYWYSETNHRVSGDWRPEIHDSDGLALATGAGERIWRPLNAPPRVQSNAFLDRDPRGFGLLQRDRAFDHYQDDGVFYNRRPSVWVEPLGRWGDGAVHLVELPTDDEIHDNVVAFWSPAEQPQRAQSLALDYRLHWAAEEPYPPSLARAVATRAGRGGLPGQQAARKPSQRKFVVDFTGGPLDSLEQRYDLTAAASASRGVIDNAHVLKVLGTPRWRASFDLDVSGEAPVDLRCHLRLGDRTLSETWLYQYLPGSLGLDA